MNRLARGLRRLVVWSLGLVLLGFAALIAVPTLAGYQTYVITTGSMAGTADPGSLVIACDTPVDELAVGDVITYLPPAETGIGHPVTHRLVSIETQPDGALLMRTKGDANEGDDPWEFVLDGAVQPRMEANVPAAGWPLLWLADPTTRMLAIGLPALLIAFAALVDVVKAWRDPDGDGDGEDDDVPGAGPDPAATIDLPTPASPATAAAPSSSR